jgi:phenylacetate-CoA oxygenase PaaI subunit
VSDPAAPPPDVFGGPSDREAAELAARAAAAVETRVETVRGLDTAVRAALYALLRSLADNKYVLGRRYAEWCTGAPMLESAVAAAAMAQDELGHARSFYPLLRGFPESSAADAMEERGWQSRPTSAVACLDRPFQTWGDFVAANFVLDTAFTVLFEAATESTYEPLRQRARKIVQEERVHWTHARGWVRRLAMDAGTRALLADGLRGVWDDACTWYGRPDDPVMTRLEAAGLLTSSPDALRERLSARLAAVPDATGLSSERAASSLPWDRWDSAARRLRPLV